MRGAERMRNVGFEKKKEKQSKTALVLMKSNEAPRLIAQLRHWQSRIHTLLLQLFYL